MKKCTIICNPRSGKHLNKEFKDKSNKILVEYGYETEFIFTEYHLHAVKIIKEIPDDVSLVISVGGDGTFNEIVTGNLKREHKLVLAHIPLGTTNDIGAMFGYGMNVYNNLKMLLNGQIKNIDICVINDRPFVYVAGFGKFLDVPYITPKDLKRKIGYFAYLTYAMKSFLTRTHMYDITYTVNGTTYRGKYSLVLITNANRIAGINNFYKNVKLDDDQFEVLFCTCKSKLSLIKSFIHIAFNDIDNTADLYWHKTDKLSIKFNKKIKKHWCIDGEEYIAKRQIYNIKINKEISIMMPEKNIQNLFVNDKQKCLKTRK